MSALAVSCDHAGCHARPGDPCIESGRVLAVFHPERCIAGRQAAFAAAGRQPPTYRGAWRDRPDQRGLAAAEDASDAADFDLERHS